MPRFAGSKASAVAGLWYLAATPAYAMTASLRISNWDVFWYLIGIPGVISIVAGGVKKMIQPQQPQRWGKVFGFTVLTWVGIPASLLLIFGDSSSREQADTFAFLLINLTPLLAMLVAFWVAFRPAKPTDPLD